ncbi:MAG: hypothetical protein CL930_05260, partial [Deltaproteobacteria bacterium]|nr:hypothetical protein [Deltaproteobacteria bacterium]
SNPRGYFDERRSIDGKTVYGIPMNTAVGLGGRTGELKPNRPPEWILGLGDSHGQGQGVRFDDTFYEKAGQALQEGGYSVSVRNVSVSGYQLEDITARYLYETDGWRRYPVVVYTLVLDDFNLEPTDNAGENFKRRLAEHDQDPWRTRSALWNAYRVYEEKKEISDATDGAYLSDFKANFRSDRFIEKADLLERLARRVEADGGQFLLAVMPLFYQLDDYPFLEVHQILAEMATARKIEMLDLYPVLKHRKAPELWVHETDHHPNELGHALVGQAIGERLIANGMAQAALRGPPLKNDVDKGDDELDGLHTGEDEPQDR